jgi:hypothetical protein
MRLISCAGLPTNSNGRNGSGAGIAQACAPELGDEQENGAADGGNCAAAPERTQEGRRSKWVRSRSVGDAHPLELVADDLA